MDIEFLNKQDTYSVLLSAIYAAEADDSYRFLSDLMLSMNTDSFKKFIGLFEGQTITIPSIDKTTKMLKAMLLYAYFDVEKLPLKYACRRAGVQFNGVTKPVGLQEYYTFKQLLKDKKVEVGGILNDFPSEGSKIIQ